MLYRFDVHNGTGFTLDEEGQSASDDGGARKIALTSIRAIVAEEAGNGRVDLRGKIDVRCEEDDTGFTVAFIDAFELLLPPEDP